MDFSKRKEKKKKQSSDYLCKSSHFNQVRSNIILEGFGSPVQNLPPLGREHVPYVWRRTVEVLHQAA